VACTHGCARKRRAGSAGRALIHPEHLENPFDQIGQDDVMINAEKFDEKLDADFSEVLKSVA